MSSLPALAARHSAALMRMMAQQQHSSSAAAVVSTAPALLPRQLRPYSIGAGARGEVVDVADDAALKKALDACAASGSGSVVNYTAAWCGPCKAMAGPMAALAKRHPGVSFFKVDIDSAALQASVAGAGVSAVPTYVVRKGGQVLETIQGARLELLQKAVEQAAAAMET